MGQAADNRGRNASLDDKKERAAGRGARNTARDFDSPQPGSGRTMGAFGSGKRSQGRKGTGTGGAVGQ